MSENERRVTAILKLIRQRMASEAKKRSQALLNKVFKKRRKNDKMV